MMFRYNERLLSPPVIKVSVNMHTIPANKLIEDIDDCFTKCNNSTGQCPMVCPIGTLCCKDGKPGCAVDVAAESPTDYKCVIVSQSGKI